MAANSMAEGMERAAKIASGYLHVHPIVKQIIQVIEADAKDVASRHTPESWRSPLDKPENLPGEYHSEDVLICMKPRAWVDEQPIKIGHVSCGHWRPAGGNGNFDDDILGWMPLPKPCATHGDGK